MDPLTIMTLMSFGTKALGARSEAKAGKEEAAQLQEQAKVVGQEALAREVDRRRTLNRILSAQTAQFAGMGIDPGTGSPVAIAEASAKEAGRDYLTDTAMTKQKQRQLLNQAAAAKKSAKRSAGLGLLGAGIDLGLSVFKG